MQIPVTIVPPVLAIRNLDSGGGHKSNEGTKRKKRGGKLMSENALSGRLTVFMGSSRCSRDETIGQHTSKK
eukprot:7037464-Pyramimonas_sp.AAC.1